MFVRSGFCLMVVLLLLPNTDYGQDQQRSSFLSELKIGQIVALKEVSDRYEITLIEALSQGQKVTDVGADFVVFEDVTSLVQRRIPIYFIKSIARIKTRAKSE